MLFIPRCLFKVIPIFFFSFNLSSSSFPTWDRPKKEGQGQERLTHDIALYLRPLSSFDAKALSAHELWEEVKGDLKVTPTLEDGQPKFDGGFSLIPLDDAKEGSQV